MIEMTESGSGPAVLLLHGLPGIAADFAPLVEALSPRWRVLVATMPGYLGAPALAEPYSMAQVTSLLAETLIARGVERVALVGHSLGGYRALALSLSGRIPVIRIVLLGGFAGLDAADRERYAAFARMTRDGVDLRPIIVELMLPPAYAAAHPADAARVGDLVDAAPRAVLAAELDAMADLEDLRPRLSSLDVPLTVRVGAIDAAIPRAWTDAIVHGAPNASLEIVEGCGHMLLLEDREATVNAVVAALSRPERRTEAFRT